MTETLPSSTTTPLTPPRLEEDRLSWLRLFRSRRVGVATFYRLLQEHGSAGAALDALPALAQSAGVGGYQTTSRESAEREMAAARKIGARLLCNGEPGYPELLSRLDDAPPLLWTMGDQNLLRRPMIAIVGARNASNLGMRMARKLAADLAEAGLVVVSGLARGIDAAAHRGALERGTAAVLAGGVDVIYPAENESLAGEIANAGLLLSEQPVGLAPQARHFPARNRIVSGMALGVIVVEAAVRSGSLITARNALDQGREVMAVPGHPFDGRASGCNLLIRDGARLIRSAEDVLEAIGPVEPAPAATARTDTAPHTGPRLRLARKRAAKAPLPATSPQLSALVLDRLGPTPQAEDQLVRDTGCGPHELAAILTDLELEGLIQRHPGGFVSLAEPIDAAD